MKGPPPTQQASYFGVVSAWRLGKGNRREQRRSLAEVFSKGKRKPPEATSDPMGGFPSHMSHVLKTDSGR